MKEQLYTIPLMDAYRAGDECPFCYIERNLEQHAMDFTLGSGASYMEDDIRAQTDAAGFCREHYRQMFVYGNRLGSALIMETHLKKLSAQLQEQMDRFQPAGKASLIGRLRKQKSEPSEDVNNVSAWIRSQNASCYICDQIQSNFDRYLATFFMLLKKGDAEFTELLRGAKGYCLPHFGRLLEAAQNQLSEKEQAQLRELLFPQMKSSMERIIEDVDWFQKKFDYRFKDADWKNAKDAVQRAMQKAGSGYSADPPYEQK